MGEPRRTLVKITHLQGAGHRHALASHHLEVQSCRVIGAATDTPAVMADDDLARLGGLRVALGNGRTLWRVRAALTRSSVRHPRTLCLRLSARPDTLGP